MHLTTFSVIGRLRWLTEQVVFWAVQRERRLKNRFLNRYRLIKWFLGKSNKTKNVDTFYSDHPFQQEMFHATPCLRKIINSSHPSSDRQIWVIKWLKNVMIWLPVIKEVLWGTFRVVDYYSKPEYLLYKCHFWLFWLLVVLHYLECFLNH